MLNVNELFPATELDMMNKYRARYADILNHEDQIDMSEVLSNYWAKDKVNLYKLLGEKLIISKQVEFNTPEEQIEEMLCNSLYSYHNNDMGLFYRAVYAKREKYHWTEPEYPMWDNVLTLFRADYLRTNKYSGWEDFVVNNPKAPDKPIRVAIGSKPIKMLGKIADAYDLQEEFETFRLAHSRILNTAKLKGTLCLSIHPMDYMTMSDNQNDWESCMSWRNHGCYRRGTVEMMNSFMVIVAYLTSSEKVRVDDYEWNSKKWRTLIVVTPNLITTVKAYPYANEDLNAAAVSWVAELANQNLGADYDFSTKLALRYDGGFRTDKHDLVYPIEFTTNAMYNDFGCSSNGHYTIVSKQYGMLENKPPEYICYSGATQCICCGVAEGVYFGEEEHLCCEECGAYRENTCPNCGEVVTEFIEVDGENLCEYCYESETEYDVIDHERHLRSNMFCVYLVDDKFDGSDSWRYQYFWVYEDNLADLSDLTLYEISGYYTRSRYCKCDELKDNMYKFFDFASKAEIKEYKTYLKR